MAHKPWIGNFPMESDESIEFWGSSHKCNIGKSFVCFSTNELNFHEVMKRYGYKLPWRSRIWANYAPYVGFPSMVGVPFSPLGPWWDCLQSSDSIDLEWLVSEVGEETIMSEDGRPILTEAAITSQLFE